MAKSINHVFQKDMIQAFRDRTQDPLHAVASSQGGHGGLKINIFTRASARESHWTILFSEHSHTEKYRESCVELVVLISFVATHLATA